MDPTGKHPGNPRAVDQADSGAGPEKLAPAADVSTRFSRMPQPPYYAVIFTNLRTDSEDTGYAAMTETMDWLARAHPGCIGLESTRDADGFGITVSYWTDEAAILTWKDDARHLVAQQMGKDAWYRHYSLRVAKVERGYTGPDGRHASPAGQTSTDAESDG